MFISYRRDDVPGVVEALDARLRQDLGSWNVFRDVHDLIAGERFGLRISDEIKRSDVVLVVVGPRWAGQNADAMREPRLFDTADFVRQEVRIALANYPHSTPIPVLVDGGPFPSNMPQDIRAISEYQCVQLVLDDHNQEVAPGYQAILVGTWLAKSRSVPNGVIVFGGSSMKAQAQLDALVDEMKRRDLIDVTRVSRYACGAQVLSMRKARHLARRYPDVIILVSDDSADSEVLAARTEAVRQHRRRRIAIVTLGGGIAYVGGVATGTGSLSNLSARLGDALIALGKPKVVTAPGKVFSWQSTMPTAAKIGAGVVIAGGAAVIAWPDQPRPASAATVLAPASDDTSRDDVQVAIGGAGDVHVMWEESGGRIVRDRTDDGEWTSAEGLTERFTTDSSLETDFDGRSCVRFFDFPPGPWEFGQWQRCWNDGQWGPPEQLVDSFESGVYGTNHRFDVTVTPDGVRHHAWVRYFGAPSIGFGDHVFQPMPSTSEPRTRLPAKRVASS